MYSLLKKLTEKQMKKALNYWRGYSFQCVRNRTIVMLLIYTDITPLDLMEFKDSDMPAKITSRLKRQIGKYRRIRHIYFYDKKQFDYFFLDSDQKPLTAKTIESILHATLRFAGVNPNSID